MKKKKNDKPKKTRGAESIVNTFRSQGKRHNRIYSDVDGSYTGMDYNDRYPVQDSDDL